MFAPETVVVVAVVVVVVAAVVALASVVTLGAVVTVAVLLLLGLDRSSRAVTVFTVGVEGVPVDLHVENGLSKHNGLVRNLKKKKI